MAEELMSYLESHAPSGFSPKPYYGEEEDSLTFYFQNDESYAQRVDELLTVFLSLETDELVGCQIKGVRRILETLGNFGVAIEDGPFNLSLLFLAGAFARDPSRRKRYEQIGHFTKNIPLDTRALQLA